MTISGVKPLAAFSLQDEHPLALQGQEGRLVVVGDDCPLREIDRDLGHGNAAAGLHSA